MKTAPLRMAAKNGYFEILQLLLCSSAVINADIWNTCLEAAALEGHFRMLCFLWSATRADLSTPIPMGPCHSYHRRGGGVLIYGMRIERSHRIAILPLLRLLVWHQPRCMKIVDSTTSNRFLCFPDCADIHSHSETLRTPALAGGVVNRRRFKYCGESLISCPPYDPCGSL